MWYRTILTARQSDPQLTLPLQFPRDPERRWKNKLFHGTTRDNFDAIKSMGLQPGVGTLAENSYKDFYDEEDWDKMMNSGDHDAVYLSDWSELPHAIGAMIYQVEQQLGRKPTLDDLKKHGLLLTVEPNENMYMMDEDRGYSNQYDPETKDFTGWERWDNPAFAESYDVYSQDSVQPKGYYQGKRLKRVLQKFYDMRKDLPRTAVSQINSMVLRIAGIQPS